MPAGQPFTELCRQLALLSQPTRADLHIHTTHSDGLFVPEEVVRRAKLAGLRAIAVTDHDTLSAIPALRAAAREPFRAPPKHSQPIYPLDVVSGVEITTEFRGRELHLLGYDVALDHAPLNAALDRMQVDRRERIITIIGQLRALGKSIPDEVLQGWVQSSNASLGRRHIAVYLAQSGQVRTVNDAFFHLLHESKVPTKRRLPVVEAIALVRQAGGVASWAHPSADTTIEQVNELKEMGLTALEAEYPWPTRARRQAIRALAANAGLAITGGSDCHGPTPVHRAIGSCGITITELRALRERAAAYNTVDSTK